MRATPPQNATPQALVIGNPSLGTRVAECLAGWRLHHFNPVLDDPQRFAELNDESIALVIVHEAAMKKASLATELKKLRTTTAVLGVVPNQSPKAGEPAKRWDAELPSRQLNSRLSTVAAPLLELTRARRKIQRMDCETEVLRQRVRVLDQVSQAIIGTDLNGRIKAWNKRAETILGYRREEVLGKPLDLIFSGDPTPRFDLHKVLEPLLIHDRHLIETDIRRRDGSVIPIHASLTLEKNIRGDVVGVICCCRDITARRRAESAKRAAYQRLEFFIERMPLAFIEWNVDGTIRAWNNSAERIFGYSSREVIGQPFSLLVKEDFIGDCRRIFDLMRAKRGGYRSRNENLTQDGRVIMCDWINTTLVDETGELIGFASIADDVTEQIRTEEELKRSREIAESANRSKNEFLAVMSHEVRTPMNSIIGFADLLMDSITNDEQAELVNIIKANTFNLLDLINNVLNYSRLESEQVHLESQEIELGGLLSEIEEIVRAEAAEKGLEFRTEVKTGTPQVFLADYLELRQVLLNLTANAIKFTSKGEVCLRVKAAPRSADEKWSGELLFSVADTGIGIDEGQKDKLFQSFTQVDSSSTRRFGGTGLGLAICRRIVELWQGRIWASKNPGAGSTFHFTLPTQSVAHQKQPSTDDDRYPEIEDERFVEVFPLNILLITPSPETHDILDRMLSNLGYRLACVADCVEGIQYLQRHPCDLVIMDDEINEFTVAEMASIISLGQAGESNRDVQVGALLSGRADRKNATTSQPFAPIQIKRPIIARNVRHALRKFAIARHSAH